LQAMSGCKERRSVSKEMDRMSVIQKINFKR